jgi:hypothetical protein
LDIQGLQPLDVQDVLCWIWAMAILLDLMNKLLICFNGKVII